MPIQSDDYMVNQAVGWALWQMTEYRLSGSALLDKMMADTRIASKLNQSEMELAVQLAEQSADLLANSRAASDKTLSSLLSDITGETVLDDTVMSARVYMEVTLQNGRRVSVSVIVTETGASTYGDIIQQAIDSVTSGAWHPKTFTRYQVDSVDPNTVNMFSIQVGYDLGATA